MLPEGWTTLIVDPSVCLLRMREKSVDRQRRIRSGWSGACARFVASLTVMSVAHISEAFAQNDTIYRETFGYCTDTLGKEAAGEARWYGVVSGLPVEKVSNLKVFPYGSTSIGGSVNSNPLGLSQGYAFWFRPVYGLSVLTWEFPFDAGLIKSGAAEISYKQRLSGIDPTNQNNSTQLIFLIDDTWYISKEFVRQVRPGVWEDATVSPSSLTYGTVPLVAGLGPVTPSTYGSPLPSAGTVRAFGLFLPEVNGRVRFDNFVIKTTLPAGSGISTTVQQPTVEACPATSPDRTGQGGGQTPPSEDDGDSTPDRGVPDLTTPTSGGDTHPVTYSFCPIKQQGTGRAVGVSPRAGAALMRKIPASTLTDLRDRAIIVLLAQRPVPLGALVNVKVADYNPSKGIMTMSTRAAAKPMRVRLRGSAKRALAQYLAFEGAPTAPTAPLFLSSKMEALHATVRSAVCLGELRSMAKTRAKSAKVSIGGIYRATR